MKKFTFTFLILLLSLGSIYPQERKAVPSGHSFNMAIGTESSDTLHYMVPPGTIYTATIGGQPAGYVNGTNGYNDLGKYQRLDFTQPNVTGHSIFLYFGAKEIVGSPDTINIVIREVDTSGAPGNLLAMIPKLTSEIDTTGPMFFPLAKEMFNGLSVFVGIEWGLNVDDKFTLISNVDPNGATPSRVWEKWDNGTFHQYGSATSWTLTIDLWVGMVYSQALGGPFYIPQGTHPRGFNTLGEAVAALNANGAAGTATFYLDADTLRENSFTFNAALSASDNVIIKPAPGRNVTLIVSSSASVGNGPFMIGFNKGYVTFDGSNDGTESRNLTITTEQVSPVVDVPFTLNNADADEVVLKNLIIKNIFDGTNFRYGAVINDLGGVTGFRVENCQIGTADRPIRRDGLAPWGGSSTANQFSFVNNEIYCGTRGVATIYLVDSEIIGNTFNLKPTTAGNTNNYNHGIYITGATGSTIIHNNYINCLEKTNVAGTYLVGIAFAGNTSDSTDIISVVNNMINVGAADETGSTYGIGLRSAGHMGNINAYFNTIVINNNASTLTSHGVGNHTNGTGPVNLDLKNNIIINKHSGNTASSAIGVIPATSVLTSNYNVLVSDQNLVNYQGTTYANLAAWQATNQDVNSVSKSVNFVSPTDLHLAGSSIGDIDLAGMPIPWITADIDGDPRDSNMPYKGADESTPFITSTVLLEENFDYGATSNPDLLAVTTNWTRHSGAAGPGYTNTSLGYSGYLSSNIGGSLNFTNGGSGVNDGDVHRTFDSLATTGNLYASFLVNLNSALTNADYFFHLGPRTLGTTFRGRVYAKNSGAGFNVALSKTGNPIVDDPTVLNFGQTYLFIVKYSLNTDATNDDLVTLYVYDSGVPQTEPGTPLVTIGPIGAGVSDGLNNIGALAIRQGTNTATGILDGIRVSTNWGDIVIPVELTSFVANSNGSNVLLNWSTATEINNSGFEVERKSSSSDWVKVGFVPGAGTTTEVKKYSFTDKNLTAGSYSYRLKQIDYDGTFAYSSIVEVDVEIPAVFDLAQNYPNPFNPNTNITYFLPVDAKVKLSVYSVTGELVKELVDDFQSAGSYTVNFDAGNLASGMYIYRIVAGDFVKSHKMMLLK